MSNKSALVIGGSGMLSGLCQELAKRYSKVGVVGRTKAKMQDLTLIDNIVPIFVDYTDLKALKNSLDKFIEDFGGTCLVVSWVHSTQPDAVLVAAKYCDEEFYEVTGHSGSQQDHVSRTHEKLTLEMGLDYHRIILGKVGNRWLTDSEISIGAIEALKSKSNEYVVGQL